MTDGRTGTPEPAIARRVGRSPSRFPHARLRDRRGQGLIEFALTIPVLLVLFVGIFEFARHYHTRLYVRNAVAEAARFAATGQTLLDEETGEQMSRAESIVAVMVSHASGLDLDVDAITIDPADGGGPEDIVQIRARYRFEFLAMGGLNPLTSPFVEFTVATTFKNEPVF